MWLHAHSACFCKKSPLSLSVSLPVEGNFRSCGVATKPRATRLEGQHIFWWCAKFKFYWSHRSLMFGTELTFFGKGNLRSTLKRRFGATGVERGWLLEPIPWQRGKNDVHRAGNSKKTTSLYDVCKRKWLLICILTAVSNWLPYSRLCRADQIRIGFEESVVTCVLSSLVWPKFLFWSKIIDITYLQRVRVLFNSLTFELFFRQSISLLSDQRFNMFVYRSDKLFTCCGYLQSEGGTDHGPRGWCGDFDCPFPPHVGNFSKIWTETASLQTVFWTAHACLNTQKYGLFCSITCQMQAHILYCRWIEILVLALVVQMLDSAVHSINYYPADKY